MRLIDAARATAQSPDPSAIGAAYGSLRIACRADGDVRNVFVPELRTLFCCGDQFPRPSKYGRSNVTFVALCEALAEVPGSIRQQATWFGVSETTILRARRAMRNAA